MRVFTAFLLADMVIAEELRFDDPVDRYLPLNFACRSATARDYACGSGS